MYSLQLVKSTVSLHSGASSCCISLPAKCCEWLQAFQDSPRRSGFGDKFSLGEVTGSQSVSCKGRLLSAAPIAAPRCQEYAHRPLSSSLKGAAVPGTGDTWGVKARQGLKHAEPEASRWKVLHHQTCEIVGGEFSSHWCLLKKRSFFSCQNIFDDPLNTVINIPSTFPLFGGNYVQ